ncbi:MAG: DNA gyrase subunit A [Methanomassiliicoccales archaeon]
MEEIDRSEANRVIHRPIEVEMQKSYIDYAMSVIVGRALPDIRDGLKPVHRKILYAMQDMGLTHNKPHKKSARVVGEVLGKYHPHGDMAAYEALVRMAQDFSMRYPLIDGQGNFGSLDGDSAAAMRYTECRLESIAALMLVDIDKNTVNFVDNFDGSLQEPEVLPTRLPNLLVNGSSGIAVGMATNIPPHNLGEVVDAIVHYIDHPEADVLDLMEHLKGPDFPTGGIIYGINGILEAYSTGRGRLKVRARAEIEELEGKDRIVVTEIPYQVNKANLIESIAELVKEKRIEGITDLRDESDREGLRIVIEVRKDYMAEVVLNQLFAHTQMEVTFGVINLALVDNQPRVLTLKEALQKFIDFRRNVIIRRTNYELEQARKREHILQGLMVAVDNLDETLRIIRAAENGEEAREALMERFELSEDQAKAILDMRLQKLTGMEIEGLRQEYHEVLATIDDLEGILSSSERIRGIIKEELLETKEAHGDDRRTEIVEDAMEIEMEDLIPVEDMLITITQDGYIKRVPLETYKGQKRGGMGLRGMQTKEEDRLYDMFIASTHDYLMFFTNYGRVYWLKAYRVPVGGRQAKGKFIANLLPRLEEGERVSDTIPVGDFGGDRYLVFATRDGLIKKTRLSAYSNVRSSGIIALTLEEGDELVEVKLTDGEREIVLATRRGQAIRFDESDVRPMGRPARGVIGVRLQEGDQVVSMAVVTPESSLLTMTENGYGKLTRVNDYRKTRRAGHGVMTIRTTERNGSVVVVKAVSMEDEAIVTSASGMVIRLPVSDISVYGRAAMGVIIMRLREGDRVIGAARLASEEDERRHQDME